MLGKSGNLLCFIPFEVFNRFCLKNHQSLYKLKPFLRVRNLGSEQIDRHSEQEA